ncbi:hypothetical protein [Cronobacter turicensis]|uniref:hypothetical protein n=1 Tax=Cronobacter turicensis TaxID=413502 RepID=UPI0024C25C0E|nr:hypothetical protein [Cronobacter turicensis]MDK1225991.1 hypothetical protein [Cronobacter turicensis]
MHGKQNYPQIALCWIANAARHFSPGHPRIKMGETSTPYPADIAEPLEPVQAIPEASQFIIYDTHQEHAWMLMLSTDDSYFNGRRECRDVVMANAWLRSEWFPWPDVVAAAIPTGTTPHSPSICSTTTESGEDGFSINLPAEAATCTDKYHIR